MSPVDERRYSGWIWNYIAEGYSFRHVYEIYGAMIEGASLVMDAELYSEYRSWMDQQLEITGWTAQRRDWPGWEELLGAAPVEPDTLPTRNSKAISSDLRWEIWERDDFRCVECSDRRDLTVDHIIPRVQGGTNDPYNLQTLCRSCNSRKGAS